MPSRRYAHHLLQPAVTGVAACLASLACLTCLGASITFAATPARADGSGKGSARGVGKGVGSTVASSIAGSVAKADRYADMIFLTVDKNSLRAELKTWPESPAGATTLRTFRIAIGKAEGDKEVEGDNRTPEGIYFAQTHIDGHALPDKYGTMAIPLDFPNPIDQVAGKTGHGIWLHGVDRDQRVEEAKVTEGCVAFYNSDIARLSAWLKSHQGVVVIAKDARQINAAKDVEAVRQRTQAWMSAWTSRNVDDYTSYYAPDFRYEGRSLKGYKEYKRRIFGTYKVMDLSFDNLRVITHPKYAVAFFNQDFRGDGRFSSIGRKVLYWERGKTGDWQIKREVFENRRFEFVTFTDAELALLSDQASSISSDKDKKAPNL